MTDQTKPMDAERLAKIERRQRQARQRPVPGERSPAREREIQLIRQDVPDLLAEIARLSAERDLWHRDATKLDALAVEFEAELSRLRAVIEEARAVVTDADETPEMIRLFLILDRGLKGAGDE